MGQRIKLYSGAASFLAAPDGSTAGDFIVPSELTDQERLDLVQRIDAGEVAALRFWAVIFGDESNVNGVRPRPGQLQSFADQIKSMPRPALYDHRWTESDAKVGSAYDARVIRDERGIEQLAAAFEVTRKEAMIDVAQNRVGEFSISYLADTYTCSVCNSPALYGGWWAELTCDCDPDQVELFAQPPIDMIEVSIVPVGAYRHTGIIAALSAAGARAPRAARSHHRGDHAMADKTAAGASAAATTIPDDGANQDHSSELAQLRAERDALKARAEQAEAAQFRAQFDAAVSARKVTPAQFDAFEAVRKSAGINAAMAIIESAAPRGDLAATRHSHSDQETPPADVPRDEALLDRMSSFRVISKERVAAYKARKAGELEPDAYGVIRHPALRKLTARMR